MTFYLVTLEYDSMAGSRQDPQEDYKQELKATTFDEAVREANMAYICKPRYNPSETWASGLDPTMWFPRRPRLMVEL